MSEIFMRIRRAGAVLSIVGLGAVVPLVAAGGARAASYRRPPSGLAQWYWQIGGGTQGLAGLPSLTAAYPAPGAANIWDTDLFQDSNTPGDGIPTGRSPVVTALHAAGKYSICYVEAGAFQNGFPDDRDFARADYGGRTSRHQMQGYPGEWWFNLAGFRHYVPGRSSSLTGAARNIAAGLARRIHWCAVEGQDALEPDDLDGYTNRSQSGARGGGWNLTRADSLGFERWLAHTAHADGLAIFQKNDPANAPADSRVYDGMIIEECNHYDDPCSGPGGDGTPYLEKGKPVLDAEYTEDGESTGDFCSADLRAGIAGALFNVDLNGRTYQPCAPANAKAG
jgi:hypothetical protein